MSFDFTVHGLLAVGMIIVLGLLGGKLARLVGVPKVTGYLLTGFFIGPSVMNVLTEELIAGISVVNDIALGLIMFAIGGVFEIHHFRKVGRSDLYISVVHGLFTMALVTPTCWAFGLPLHVALILGAISITTAPAATLLVIREYEASGELTDAVMTILGITTIMCIMTFELVCSITDIQRGADAVEAFGQPFYQLGGALLIGGAVGWLLSWGEQWVSDQAELLLIIVAGVLSATGLAYTFHVSPLFTTLVVGAITTNLSMMHRLLYAELRQTEQPLYIAFFVLSGGNLHLHYLAQIGLAGIGYVVARSLGKYLGAYFASRRRGFDRALAGSLGLALFCQGSVAIGLSHSVGKDYPDIGRLVLAIILAGVIIFETAGPILLKVALRRAGEIQAATTV